MINKSYKSIHNKLSNFFKFIFFIRYVFAIFLIAIVIFFSIPNFFDYQKKADYLKDYLTEYYDLEIKNYSSIKYNIFPLPNLSLKDINLKIKNKPVFLTSKDLRIFLNIENIYNYKKFIGRKVSLKENKIILDIDKTRDILFYFQKIKYGLAVKNLYIDLKKEGNSVLILKNINFFNYGYKKNKIRGEIFNKKFQADLNENRTLVFKILDSGVKANLKFDKNSEAELLTGSSKINILKNYLKFKFILKNDQVNLIKANFRNKDLSLIFDSSIKFDPFFEINSDVRIDMINKKLINHVSLTRILESKEILKKLNSTNKITYNKKSSFGSFIKSHSSELSLAHGRIFFVNKTSILAGAIDCKGDSILIEEYPRLNFNCFFDIKDKEKFLKNFSISEKIDNKPLKLNVIGSLNLLNKKINFEKISTSENYIAREEDKFFFKETFEKTLFNVDFFVIFILDKFKIFILEII